MRIREHIFISSFLLATAAALWGLAEVVTILATNELKTASYLTYLSIIAFPLVLYCIAGALIGGTVAVTLHVLINRKGHRQTNRNAITLYLFLYFTPLLFSIEYIWNRRFLPGISFSRPISLLHSLLILLAILTVAFLCRSFIRQILSGKLTLLKSMLIGLIIGISAVTYLEIRSAPSKSAPASGAQATPEKPNVLLITIDTLRADHLGCYGDHTIHTETIDSLAAGGVRFDHATSQVPLTLPSHTSILTSTYPPIHGVRDNARYRFNGTMPTLAEILKANGYLTCAFISAFVLDSRFGLDRGFDHYDDNIQNQALFYFFSASPPFALAGALKILGMVPPYKPERRADRTTEAAIRWLGENRQQLFFLWIHYFDPHGPLNPPAPYDTLYLGADVDRKAFLEKEKDYIAVQGMSDSRGLSREEIEGIKTLYSGEVTFTDHSIGVLMRYLRESHLSDRTLIVLMADHGQSIAEHHYIGHSMQLYQDIMRIPLIIHYPPSIPAGAVVENNVQSVDVMPTILGILGIGIPGSCRGRNLMPLVRYEDDNGEDPGAYIETLHPPRKENRLFGLIWGDFKYIRGLEGNREELYRISTDPGEQINLAGRESERTERMRGHLQDLLKGMKEEASSHEIPLDPQTMQAMRALGYVQ